MNPKTLQYIMGHSDIGVTLNTYTHFSIDDAKEEDGKNLCKCLINIRTTWVEDEEEWYFSIVDVACTGWP